MAAVASPVALAMPRELLRVLGGVGLPTGVLGEHRQHSDTGKGQQTGHRSQHHLLLHDLVLSIRRCVCVVGPGIVPGRYVGTLYEGKTGTRTVLA